jgi:hypothetical protein
MRKCKTSVRKETFHTIYSKASAALEDSLDNGIKLPIENSLNIENGLENISKGINETAVGVLGKDQSESPDIT